MGGEQRCPIHQPSARHENGICLHCGRCGEPMDPAPDRAVMRCPDRLCGRKLQFFAGVGWRWTGWRGDPSPYPHDLFAADDPLAPRGDGRGRGRGASERQGRALALDDPDPWPEPVDGGALLQEISTAMRAGVAMPTEAADAVALWTVHAAGHDAAETSPLLALLSAEKRSGKTTLRRRIGAVVPRPLATSSISAPALYRVIEAARPTLLADEGDTWLSPRRSESESAAALRGVIASGWTRDEVAIRCDGEGNEPRAYSTWAPKVICAIGDLPDTIADRAIVVRLHRRRRNERIERTDRRALAALDPLRRKAWRWARDNEAALTGADPPIPPELDDRAADNWRPLLAIADRVGGEWPERARRAAVALSALRADAETVGIMLLGDLRTIWAERGEPDRIGSGDLVGALRLIEGRPWAEWGRDGRGLTPHGLARLLAPYGVRPRPGPSGTARGYYRVDLADLWDRYLPIPPATTAEPQQSLSVDVANLQNQTVAREITTVAPLPTVDGGRCGSDFVATVENCRSATSSDGENYGLAVVAGGVGQNKPTEWFITIVNSFVSVEGNTLGPYCPGDPVPPDLPVENLRALRKWGATTTLPPPPPAWTCPADSHSYGWLGDRWGCAECRRPAP